MLLTKTEKKRVIQLAKGVVHPETGIEKHFMNVCKGRGQACTPKEKEWFAYWQEYSLKKKQTQPFQEKLMEILKEYYLPFSK